MCRKYSQQHATAIRSAQRGSMLVISLFVIIVLALLGLTMTRLLSSSSESIIYEVLGQRALNAARAGIECALAEQFKQDPLETVCAHTARKEFNGIAGLENCSYDAKLPNSVAITDGVKNYAYLTFTSTGQCSAGKINVTRVIYIDAMLEVE
jgi:MSHA biogenesis protein MshP